MYHCGQVHFHNVLITDLLGPSLKDLFNRCNRRFTIKTVLMLVIKMTIHEKNLVHRDIKPDNFLVGRSETTAANDVYIIDFGMVKEYRNSKKQHIPTCERRSLSGTARYMSINTHLHREYLPWQGVKEAKGLKYRRIGEIKQAIGAAELCKGYPIQFEKYLIYVRGLGFKDTPDYVYLQGLLS
ncbi:kinase-like domain-containing protein [Diplogelasinospora grovesii]|uniref:non-specific serine/threonine protein kinase n=1 Tax=Diplogelasinospora grovesii TaxID=303347 RepID=A0AAN6RXX7_9PEZI|nr:kinase-like domain-containing protein [Diplogelasinospora grovesii]